MYTISTDKSMLDIELIHRFLSGRSYWAQNISRELVERSIANSLCFGVYDVDSQVGFARAITDFATVAYVADVFVIESHRGRGISKQLMAAMLEHPSLKSLRRWHLVTTDAHDLYRQFGFHELESPHKHMEIVVKDPYRR
jgi:N-acetylglutamate synthase-like GNAT family acetyltransferase